MLLKSSISLIAQCSDFYTHIDEQRGGKDYEEKITTNFQGKTILPGFEVQLSLSCICYLGVE